MRAEPAGGGSSWPASRAGTGSSREDARNPGRAAPAGPRPGLGPAEAAVRPGTALPAPLPARVWWPPPSASPGDQRLALGTAARVSVAAGHRRLGGAAPGGGRARGYFSPGGEQARCQRRRAEAGRGETKLGRSPGESWTPLGAGTTRNRDRDLPAPLPGPSPPIAGDERETRGTFSCRGRVCSGSLSPAARNATARLRDLGRAEARRNGGEPGPSAAPKPPRSPDGEAHRTKRLDKAEHPVVPRL